MKEIKDIDKLLLDSLADHKPTPSPGSKKRFLISASGIMSSNFKQIFNWKSTIVAIILLLGTGSILYYYLPYSPDKTETSSQLPVVEQHVNSTKIPSQSETENILDQKTTQKKQNENNFSSGKNEERSNKEVEVSSIPLQTSPGKINNSSATEILPDNLSKQRSSGSDYFTILASLTIAKVYNLSAYKNSSLLINYQNTDTSHIETKVLTGKPENDRRKQSNSQKIDLAYTISYQPELIFNIIENNKIVHNMGANIHFRIFDGKYQIRTGIGASISKGYYEYAVNYNEYMGSYLGLDSITFAWSDNNYYLLPTYYQSKREVFDTAVQFDVSKVYKRFIYLQLPITFGYDFIQKEKYSLGLRFGPVLSVLSSTRTISSSYDPGNNKIIQINQVTPDRIQTNWSLMAGLNMSIYSKKNLYYEVEPQFSYYFNSVYQKDDATNPPFSLGIRFAIGIK